MADTSPPRRAAAVVSAQAQLFDFRAVYSFRTAEDGVSSYLNDEQANVTAGRRELGFADMIAAKGLIDVRHDWWFGNSGGDRTRVEWLAPGPIDGAFALDDEWNPKPDAARTISCEFRILSYGHTEVSPAHAHATQAGWGLHQLKRFGGWARVGAPRWEGDLHTAFPAVEHLADTGATERANRLLDPDDVDAARLRTRPALPFVLRCDPKDDLTLNPDALDGLVLTLPPQHFLALQRLVEAGCARVGRWSGHVLIAPGDFEVVAVGDQVVRLATTDAAADQVFRPGTTDTDAGLRQRRFKYALSCLMREARLTWQPHLPPVEYWRHSAVHRALVGCLPSLARQSLRDDWSADRRRDVFESVLSLTLDSRLGLRMLERLKLGDEKHIRAQAAELIRQDRHPTRECWALYELGIGNIDPLSFEALQHPGIGAASDGHGITTADLADLANRYEAVPGLWSPELAHALIHGLLLAETGPFLASLPARGVLDLGATSLLTTRQEFLRLPAVGALRLKFERAAAREWWGRVGSYFLSVALFSTIGAWVAEWRGLAVALVLGVLVNGMLIDRTRQRMARTTARQLQRTMLLAVRDAAQPNVSWWLVLRRMQHAALQGAVWAPEAWRLATRAARRSPASRLDW